MPAYIHTCLHMQHNMNTVISLSHTCTQHTLNCCLCAIVCLQYKVSLPGDINPIVSPWGTPALYQGKNVLRARSEAVTKLHKRTCLPHQSAFPKGDKGADIPHGRGILTTTIVVVPARGYAHANEPWLRICPKCCNVIGGNSPACILCFTSGVWVESQFTLCFHSNTN